MKNTLIVLFILLSVPASRAQTIAAISSSICDSINKIEHKSDDEFMSAQLSVYHYELVKYPTLIVDITDLNKPHQFNEFNYKINRQLIRTCPVYRDQFTLLPLSKILDVEGLLNKNQYDSLERNIIEFIHSKKMDLLIITMDDLFPFDNFKDFSLEQGKKWKIGGRYQRGGIIVVVSKELREIRISLSEAAEKFISDEDCREIIDNIMMPYFKKDFFYKGLMKGIEAIKRKT